MQALRDSVKKPAMIQTATNNQQSAADPDQVWEPRAVMGKFGPAELGDRQENTVGRTLFRHNPGGKADAIQKATAAKEAHPEWAAATSEAERYRAEAEDLLEKLSWLQRSSLFPGSVSAFPKKSVTHQMLEECRPFNPEYRVDKTHMAKKYDVKTFMEAEFKRRLLLKSMVKDQTPG